MKKAKAQGIGVHSQEEIIEFGKNDLRVLSDYLSDRPFFFGDEPTLVSLTDNLAGTLIIKKVLFYFMWLIVIPAGCSGVLTSRTTAVHRQGCYPSPARRYERVVPQLGGAGVPHQGARVPRLGRDLRDP